MHGSGDLEEGNLRTYVSDQLVCDLGRWIACGVRAQLHPRMDDIPELSVDEVEAKLGTPNFYVFDNNGQGRWARSHVPTAKNVNPHLFEASALPTDKTATLVFYCSGPG